MRLIAFILFLFRQHLRFMIFLSWLLNHIKRIIRVEVLHTILFIQDLIIWSIGFYYKICEMLKQICEAVKNFFK